MRYSINTEAQLERFVLAELSRERDVAVYKNESASGYPTVIKHLLQKALAPFGPAAVQAAMSVLAPNYQTFGMGRGSPDLVGSAGGRFFSLELKHPTGSWKYEDGQREWHAAARSRGAFVASPVRSVGEAVEAVERARRGEVE